MLSGRNGLRFNALRSLLPPFRRVLLCVIPAGTFFFFFLILFSIFFFFLHNRRWALSRRAATAKRVGPRESEAQENPVTGRGKKIDLERRKQIAPWCERTNIFVATLLCNHGAKWQLAVPALRAQSHTTPSLCCQDASLSLDPPFNATE